MDIVRKNIVNIIKVLAFALIFVLLYLRVEYVLEERTSNDKYAAFFKEKQDFQVLFMGNSHVTNGIYPMELYRRHGFTSYNFGGHANTMPTTYWIAKNALEYTKPELMVVDMRLVGSEKMHSDEVRYLHISLDCFPLNRVKLDAINDLLTGEEKPEFLWKMWIYHDRWNELDEKDFTGEKKPEMGAEYRINISEKARENRDYDRSIMLPQETVGVRYLERLTEECREKGIELLFIYMPISIENEDAPEINSAPGIAERLGVRYLDLNEAHLVDYSLDYFDNNGHLNPSGARKVTEYLGDYIKENYEITDVRGQQAYSHWDAALEEYDAMKKEKLEQEEELYNFLMLLYDKDYEAEVTLYDETLLQDEKAVGLLKNAGLYESVRVVGDKEAQVIGEDAGVLITVRDSVTKDTVCERTF